MANRQSNSHAMSFSHFIKRFGSGVTSNHQLSKWAKDLGIINFHVVMRDEMKDLPDTNPLNIIVNLEKSNQTGSDWNAVYISKPNAFYYSSYGLPPLKEAKRVIEKRGDLTNRLASTIRMQDPGDSYCGQAALYFLYRMNTLNLSRVTSEDFEDTVLDMHKSITSFDKDRG